MTALIVLILYLVPTGIAYSRKHHNRAAVAATNVLLGWTFLGWIVAFIWALTAVKGGGK